MDRMIFFIVLYLLACYLISRISITDKYKRLYSVIMVISVVVVIFGCLSPINYIYTFIFAYALLMINFILAKFFFNNSINRAKY